MYFQEYVSGTSAPFLPLIKGQWTEHESKSISKYRMKLIINLQMFPTKRRSSVIWPRTNFIIEGSDWTFLVRRICLFSLNRQYPLPAETETSTLRTALLHRTRMAISSTRNPSNLWIIRMTHYCYFMHQNSLHGTNLTSQRQFHDVNPLRWDSVTFHHQNMFWNKFVFSITARWSWHSS